MAAGLVDARIVTLLGPGGAGKTRLATEVARRHGGTFAAASSGGACGRATRRGGVHVATPSVYRTRRDGRGRLILRYDGVRSRSRKLQHVLAPAHMVETLVAAAPTRRLATSVNGSGSRREGSLKPCSTPDVEAHAVGCSSIDWRARRHRPRLRHRQVAACVSARRPQERARLAPQISTSASSRERPLSGGPVDLLTEARTADERNRSCERLAGRIAVGRATTAVRAVVDFVGGFRWSARKSSAAMARPRAADRRCSPSGRESCRVPRHIGTTSSAPTGT